MKYKRVFKRWLPSFIILAPFLLIVGSSGLQAQNNQNSGNGFSLSPLVQQFPALDSDRDAVQPGEQLSFDLSVSNVSPDPLIARAEFNNFIPRGETGSPQILSNDNDTGAEFGLRDLFLPIEDFQLEPGESTSVKAVIDLPQNISPGAHYGIVRFTAVTPDGDETVSLSASVGTIVLVNVAGEATEDLSLLELGVEKAGESGAFFESGPLAVFARMQNNGNTFQAPFGTISVKNFFGSTVQEYEFNEARGNVLPDSTRKYVDQLEDKFYFGRYTVEANIAYGEGGGNIITADTSFWVLPWKIVAAVVGGLIVVFGGGWLFLRSYRKKIEGKSRRF